MSGCGPQRHSPSPNGSGLSAMRSAADHCRVLLAVLVYNGQDFVPRCLESARRVMDHTDGAASSFSTIAAPNQGGRTSYESCATPSTSVITGPREISAYPAI